MKALNGQLAAYAEYLGGVIDAPAVDTAATARETERRLQGFRTELDAFEAAERAEQMRLRAAGTTLRNRATRIAAVGLVVLLALIALLAFGAVRAIVGPVGAAPALRARTGRRARRGPACPRPARRRPPSCAAAFNLSAENLQRATDRHLAELDAVFRDSPLGIAFLDLELRFLRVNEALARDEPGARRRIISAAASARSPASTTSSARCSAWSRPGSRSWISTSRCTGAASRRATSPSATIAASCWRWARR